MKATANCIRGDIFPILKCMEAALTDSSSARRRYRPQWRIEDDGERFRWLMDGDRGVALLDLRDCVFELRCHGPDSVCPPASLPKHYHTPTYTGIRVIFCWRSSARLTTKQNTIEIGCSSEKDGIRFECRQTFEDASCAKTSAFLHLNQRTGAYQVDVKTSARFRKVMTSLEYCNLLPAGIGDSREEFERFPFTYWSHPRKGLLKMGKNPLWFNSVESQDVGGMKRIAEGGFIGFGPDPVFNPVMEIVSSNPPSGAATCDCLQDEHIMVACPEGRDARDGWFRLSAEYRIFSIPPELAFRLADMAKPMPARSFQAWKYQYPPLRQIPEDLTKVPMPGSPFYGDFDWSRPVSWDRPFNGQLWTASPLPESPIYWDPKIGYDGDGSIRLRAKHEAIFFTAASGHTLHLRQGRKYTFSGWIKTEGEVSGRIEAREMLYSPWSRVKKHLSRIVLSNSTWTKVSISFLAKGEDYPFVALFIHAKGTGSACFSKMAFHEEPTIEGISI